MTIDILHIQKGLRIPTGRPAKRQNLNALVALAREMQPGDAVALRLSDANVMRIILVAQGFDCVTDGYACTERGKILVFKLATPRPQELTYEI